MSADVSAARRIAWVTRRAKYGQQGHARAYRRPLCRGDLLNRALTLVVRQHLDGVLTEGQVCRALDLDRIAFRELCDRIVPPEPGDERWPAYSANQQQEKRNR